MTNMQQSSPRHKSPPLTDEQKEAVLELWTVKRVSMKSIASIMGVSISVIHRTIRREELLRQSALS